MRKIGIIVIALLGITSLHAQHVLWAESSDGDLSSNYLLPTSLTLQAGDNLLTASFNNVDRDLFTITVPTGLVMDGLWMGGYVHSNSNNVSFLGMQEGSILSSAPSSSFPDEIGYTLFGAWALDGTNLLPIITSYPVLPDPLPAGQYAFWLNETTAATATTTLRLHATAIPEVSTPLLLVASAMVYGLRRRRRNCACGSRKEHRRPACVASQAVSRERHVTRCTGKMPMLLSLKAHKNFPVRLGVNCEQQHTLQAHPIGGDASEYSVGGRESFMLCTVLACLICMVFPCQAEQTLWLYGSSDNSSAYGVTADASHAITWKDNWGSEQNPTTARAGSISLQANRPSSTGANESVICYGWGGLSGISGMHAARIKSVVLYYKQDYGHSVTWQLYGLPVADAAFDGASTTWDDLDGTGPLDWSASTMGASSAAGLSLGTFTSNGELGTDTVKNIDITRAFKMILQGCIGGMAIGNFSNGSTLTGTDQRLLIFSNENATATNRPGLLVTLYDEPKSPTYTSYSKGTNGFTLGWNSEGAAVQVQRSTDLLNWSNIGECQMGTSYTDPNPPAGKAFYRLMIP